MQAMAKSEMKVTEKGQGKWVYKQTAGKCGSPLEYLEQGGQTRLSFLFKKSIPQSVAFSGPLIYSVYSYLYALATAASEFQFKCNSFQIGLKAGAVFCS